MCQGGGGHSPSPPVTPLLAWGPAHMPEGPKPRIRPGAPSRLERWGGRTGVQLWLTRCEQAFLARSAELQRLLERPELAPEAADPFQLDSSDPFRAVPDFSASTAAIDLAFRAAVSECRRGGATETRESVGKLSEMLLRGVREVQWLRAKVA